MSDYLWDKSGEPEEDVKQLEELLGQLRFQPRTFEVPAILPVVPRRASRAAVNFSWPRLAVAASLALTLLAGAWLVFTKQKTASAPAQAANNGSAGRDAATARPTQPTTENGTQPNTNQLASGLASGGAAGEKSERRRREAVERISAPESGRRQRREFISAGQKRPAAPQRQLTGRELNAQREQIANSTQADAVALTPQERDAMEKFVLAMRVTSEKLNYAERQVQSMSDSSPRR
jgi:hypothetical protein